ncbi:nucleolar protein 4 [[Candida] jaroonii]|uniref:Nucleolar protein 4 n=1 Tax=[Candida] jaroonii TaxID=467808 RepID=A0ACA9Y559_9ASCO|nr:nucleolar protein 4 [[Candida] jaroonii]
MSQDTNEPKVNNNDGEGLDRKTLFVRSIPFESTSEELSEYFSQFVPVKHAVIVTDDEQKSRGFGFVSFTEEEDTLNALVKSKTTKFKGRLLRVDIAKRRDRKTDNKEKKEGSTIEKRRSRLIIRNLPWSCKKPDQLKTIFSKYGAVFDAYIPKKKNGQMLGFAFVVMKKKIAAEKAVKESVGLKIDGREVAVDLAVEKSKWEEDKVEEEEESEESGDEDDKEEEDEDEEDDEENDEEDEEDEDEEDEDDMEEDDEDDEAEKAEEEQKPKKNKQEAFSIFIRNIPYDTTAEDLKEHFQKFGPVKYALPVVDRQTGLAKGSAFVAFFKEQPYAKCLDNAPKVDNTTLLISDDVLPEYVFQGRVLNISSAVDRRSANLLAERNSEKRKEALGKEVGDKDRRNMFLLNEGRITENSKLAQYITKTDMELREKSYKLRHQQLQKNPSLHLSLTRLAIRNLPRAMNSKALKALGRKAVVGFATDVKNGDRQPLSKEEISRSIKLKHDDKEVEEVKTKKSKHAGVVKQAKVINEVKGSGETGRSRGYGFVEFRDHKSALMGLRWLNAHEVTPEEILEGLNDEEKKLAELTGLNKRRLIVEFAVENAQVVKRRKDKVFQARTNGKRKFEGEEGERDEKNKKFKGKKGKQGNMNKGPKPQEKPEKPSSSTDDNIKRIIGKKRKQRKNKK